MSSGKTPFFPEPSDGPNLKGMCYVIWIIVLELSPLGIIKLPFIDSVVLLIDNVLGNHLWVTASTWNVKMLTWKITQIICACRGVNILLIVFSEFIPVWMRLLVTFFVISNDSCECQRNSNFCIKTVFDTLLWPCTKTFFGFTPMFSILSHFTSTQIL